MWDLVFLAALVGAGLFGAFLVGYTCAMWTGWRLWKRLVRDRPVELVTWVRSAVEEEPV